jgi:hypothetical protein
VFQWYDEGKLTPAEADGLYEQLAVLDLPRINKLFSDTMKAKVCVLVLGGGPDRTHFDAVSTTYMGVTVVVGGSDDARYWEGSMLRVGWM